jgi:hypothetical protein
LIEGCKFKSTFDHCTNLVRTGFDVFHILKDQTLDRARVQPYAGHRGECFGEPLIDKTRRFSRWRHLRDDKSVAEATTARLCKGGDERQRPALLSRKSVARLQLRHRFESGIIDFR